jgi:hypothetical protein
MSWVPACAGSAGYRQFDRGPADQADQVNGMAQPMPQPAPRSRAVGDQAPQADSVAQPHPADQQEAEITVALDPPISQYHTMSPKFVADANETAGTLPICNSTASRMAMPMRLRMRMPWRELVVQNVVNWRTVSGYGRPWRGGSDWIGRPSR